MPPQGMDLQNMVAYVVTFRDACFDLLLPSADSLVHRLYSELYPLSRGIVVLTTCNRFEIYLDSPAQQRVDELVTALLISPKRLEGAEAAEHLLRVASGIESAIVGEDEILGQVREAWVKARREGYSSELLDAVFHAALTAGSRARSETAISRGVLGYPQAAVELAARRLGGLDGARVLIVGAGMAANIMASHLCSKWRPSELVAANRTPSKAAALVKACKGVRTLAVGLDGLGSVGNVDVVLVAVKGGTRPELEVLRKLSRLVVDISTPPAIAAPDFTISDVERLVEDNVRQRMAEVPKVEVIVRQELRKLEAFIRRKAIDEAISTIMRSVAPIIDEEAKVTAKNIAGGADPYKAVEVALNSTIRKALWPLLSYLREDPELRAELAWELAKRYEGLASKGA